jgi:hypothetical protein
MCMWRTYWHFTANALAVFFKPMSRSPNVLRSFLWDETRTTNNTSTIKENQGATSSLQQPFVQKQECN